MIGVGVIGFGRIARLKHQPVLRGSESADLVAVADNNPQHLAAFKGAAYSDYRDLLADPSVEAVIVALPSGLHAAAAVAAFEAGKHVYVEKPLATTLADAHRVRDAWRTAGTVGMTGFNFRFFDQYQAMRQAVAAGTVGDILHGQATFTNKARSLPHWKRTRDSGGGALLDLASHLIDLTRYLLQDEVASLVAQIGTYYTEQDNATLTITLRSGVSVQLLVSMSGAEVHRFGLTGAAGQLTVDRYDAPKLSVQSRDFSRSQADRLRRVLQPRNVRHTPDYNSPFAKAIGCFADAIAGQPVEYPTIEDGVRSLEVVIAAEKSAETQQVIHLESDR